jgi:hypothetical protein
VAFLAAAAVLVGFSLTAFGGDGKDLMIQITTRDQVLLYPLSVDRTVDIEGPLGISRVSIENDTVRMVSSPCPDQLCLHMGDIHKAGRWIACLPNQVFVRILGQEGGDLDAKSY